MSTTTPNYGWILPGVDDPADANQWGTQLNSNITSQDTIIKSISDAANTSQIPSGSVFPYVGSTAPTGFLLCFGQAVNRTTYAALFAIIGTAYGAGDGSTTFNLPDVRGRVLAGKDDMGGSSASRLTATTMTPDGNTLGASGGAQTHTLTAGQVPVLSGTVDGSTAFGSGSGNSLSTTGTGSGSLTVTVNSGGGAAHNNVQPSLIVNYIIKT
jgi:microcystin-dependent protein